MGSSAFILMKKSKYTPERLLADTIVAVFHAKAMLYFQNDQRFLEDGRFSYTTLNINDKPFNEENKRSLLYYIDGTENNIDFYYYEELNLDPSQDLCRVGCIEEIYGTQELIFRFIYEYLKLNPDDYFWIADYDWVYSWEDMQKLKSLPYDPDWCYKNPKLI